MKKLNRIIASILLIALFCSFSVSASAWDELYEDEGEAEGEIYIDTQPLPMPVDAEYTEDTFDASVFNNSCADESPDITSLQYTEATISASDFSDPWEDEPESYVWYNRFDYDNAVPVIYGTPLVESYSGNEQGSVYYTYLRASANTHYVAIAYYSGNTLLNAKVFSEEYIYDWNADGLGSRDFCLPYVYSPAGSNEDHSRTTFLRASYDGINWSAAYESASFIVIPREDESIDLDVPYYMQNDSKWKNTLISTKTLGAVGCTTTCIAMLYSHIVEFEVNPGEMRYLLTYSGNDLNWSSVKKLMDIEIQTYDHKKITNDDLQQMLDLLREGKPAIISGKTSDGRQHWVVISGYEGNPADLNAEDFKILDPSSKSRTDLSSFLKYKPNLYKLVYPT